MSAYTQLQQVANRIAALAPAIESVNLCANFIRRKQAEPDKYPTRTEAELVAQLLEAEARLHEIAKGL